MSPIRWTARPAGIAALLVHFLIVLGNAVPAVASSGPSGQAPTGAAEGAAADAFPKSLKQAGRDFLRDTGRIWTSPARIRKRDVFPLLALAAGTAFLIVADEPIRDGVSLLRGPARLGRRCEPGHHPARGRGGLRHGRGLLRRGPAVQGRPGEGHGVPGGERHPPGDARRQLPQDHGRTAAPVRRRRRGPLGRAGRLFQRRRRG